MRSKSGVQMKNLLSWIGFKIPIPEDDWFTKLRNQYDSIGEVAFQCPECHHIQSFDDLKQRGEEPAKAYLLCLKCGVSVYQVKQCTQVVTMNGAVIRLFPLAPPKKEFKEGKKHAGR